MRGAVISDASVPNAALGAVLSHGHVALEGPHGSNSKDADHKAGKVQTGRNYTKEADGCIATLDHAVHGGVTTARVQPLTPLASFRGVHLGDKVQVETNCNDVAHTSQQAEGTFTTEQPHLEAVDGFCPHYEEDERERCCC